jgi:A/G-specific adenine glycosylase
MVSEFAERLLRWYAHHQRQLPWRVPGGLGRSDPYHVWVSEIMLQQTQVETVIPYYQRWLERFPTLAALASADQQSVLAVWEGLGYYSRARNLHRAAQQVQRDLGGALPRTPGALRALPGIGRYTAGAIASIAFGADTAVLDGNVKRVLARAFDLRDDVKSPAGEKALWALAESLVPPGRAGDYNQALMDLGATLCVPRNPLCLLCPVSDLCEARRLGVQHERPVTPARRAVPHRVQLAAVVAKGGRVLLEQRAESGLLGGLWAFPAVPLPDEAAPSRRRPAMRLRHALRTVYGLTVTVGPEAQVVEHGFSHFSLTVRVFDCAWQAGALKRGGPPRKWVKVSEFADWPMGKVDRLIAKRVAGARLSGG